MDIETLTAAFEQSQRMLFAVSMRILKDVSRAEDNVQDTFLKANAAKERFRGDCAITTWLVAIATNEARMKLRASKSQLSQAVFSMDLETLPIPTKIPSAHRLAAGNQVLSSIRHEIQACPVDCLAFMLSAYHGYTMVEIAKYFDISVGAAKAKCFRGRAELREVLGAHR